MPDGHPIKKGGSCLRRRRLRSSHIKFYGLSQSVNGGMREKGERGRGRPNSVGAYAKSPGSLIAPFTGCFNEGVAIFVKLTGRGTYSK